MEFRLLGPVEVVCDGTPIELGRRRERVILAILLLETGRPVSVERLIELLFDEHLPRDPRKAIQVDISRLRRTLAVPASDEGVRVTGDAAGYTIHAPPETVDVHRFSSLVDSARATEDRNSRRRLLAEALDLWRAPALHELGDTVALQSIRAQLEEQRLAAIELRVDTELALGRHTDLVAELTDLTAQYPNSERLVATKMLALYRSGRKRDALDVYQRTAGRLVEELGLDPGPDLRETHLAILRDDAELAAPAPASAGTTTPVVQPAQLPADLPAFTGRDDELVSLLARSRLPHDTVVISAIDGMAGIGKTALAVHAAHRLTPDYPDGQLFIDLNGFTEGADPVTAADALGRLLRALGVPDAQIPPSMDERATLYRSTLATRRVLVLLDNAASEDQVEPLLPGTPGCLALVTSRSRLAGLAQASSLSLDVLPPAEAAALFARVAGVSRLADDPPELIDEVVELCDRLPLAIRIAAARLRTRSAWTLRYLHDRLRDEHLRLAELDSGRRSVAGAFRLSYEQLTEPQARMFRLLGLHPGYDIGHHAAASLADMTVHEADQVLSDLLDAHLLQQHESCRYHLHDLLRAYSVERATVDENAAERGAALARLCDHYSSNAAVAMDLVYPYDPAHRPDVPAPRTEVVPLDDPGAALSWLDAELANLISVATRATRDGHLDASTTLPQIIWRHLDSRGRLSDATRLLTEALDVAVRQDDRREQARSLARLGATHGRQGRVGPAVDCLQRSVDLARQARDRLAEMEALVGLGGIHHLQSDPVSAGLCLRRAYDLAREVGDRAVELDALTRLGFVYAVQGSYQRAVNCFERGRDIADDVGNVLGQVELTNGFALVHREAGRPEVAEEAHRRALGLARRVGCASGEFGALVGLGEIYNEQGHHGQAAECFRHVLTRALEIGDRNYQFAGVHGLGKSLRASGDAREAVTCELEALTLARAHEQRYDEAAAHEALADAKSDLDRSIEARIHWQWALDIFTELDAPAAARAQAGLARLDTTAPI